VSDCAVIRVMPGRTLTASFSSPDFQLRQVDDRSADIRWGSSRIVNDSASRTD